MTGASNAPSASCGGGAVRQVGFSPSSQYPGPGLGYGAATSSSAIPRTSQRSSVSDLRQSTFVTSPESE